MAKTFRKRTGTTNRGIDYEILNIANMVLNLVTDAEIQDFHISSNDEEFGGFDDIVIETERKTGTEIYAFQLKHSDRGNLYLKQLTQSKGDFSIKKYFHSVQNLKRDNVKFILYTNLKFTVPEGIKFCLDGENFPVTLTKKNPKNAFQISHKTDYCYQFSIVEGCVHEKSTKILLYEKFFQNLFLYTDQENSCGLKRKVTENFKSSFCGNEVESDQFVKFLHECSLQEGIKEKFNKRWMRLAIGLKILFSRIEPLSFDCIQDGIESSKIIKRNIFREAIAAFDIVVFRKESSNEIRNLWDDAKRELKDLKIINKLIRKYQLVSNYVSDVDEVDDLTLNILLWLMGKCPLVLTQDDTVHKALELCSGQKFLLLTDHCVSLCATYKSVFETLSDLKVNTLQYNHLIKTFTCSLQGKKEIRLENLIKQNEEILSVFKTDDLLEMCEGQCRIGGARKKLPEPYIERCLLKNAIDVKVLDNLKESVVIVDCVSRKKDFKKKLKRHNLIKLDDFLIKSKESSRELSVCLSKRRCSYREFNTVCKKFKHFAKNFHQFRVRDDGNLEWIRSKGDVSEVERFGLSKYYKIHESDLSSTQFENHINLLVSDSGMGKSELMKSLKINCFADYFTIIVDPNDVYYFLKNMHGDNYLDAFRNFLFYEKYKTMSKRDKEIFRIFLKTNKIVYVWEALDELSDKYRDIVTKIILKLPKTCVQWVTSRCHLQNSLEKKFNVLSLTLKKFDEEEQRNYIRKRLIDVSPVDEIEIIITKIESSFALVEHKDILGIPLQIFMLTELLRRDREKYFALLYNIFTLTDLYTYFIEEKIHILYREKLGMNMHRSLTQKIVQSHKDKLLAEYTNAALRLLFSDEILSELHVRNDNLQKIHENDGNIGLVMETEDQIPRFLHTSFAEYLAARYFADNHQYKNILMKFIFDQKYNNVRFFFDLILARDSRAHIAILYRNFNFIQNSSIDFLTVTDSGGRSLLHLACSWGQRYPELSVKYSVIKNTYTVDDEGIFKTVQESKGYSDIITFLLEVCDVSKPDQICNLTPEEYARNTTCILPEMRIIMQQNTAKSLKTDRLVNILYYSACSGHYNEFKYFFQIFNKRKLFRKIVDSVRNKMGKTLLYIANLMGHAKIVEFLITEGADICLAGEHGFQPLKTASFNGNYEIVEFIVRAGADVNVADENGDTPLSLAASKGHYRVVEFLVEAGADVNLVNEDGDSPLNLASFHGHQRVVEFLVKRGAALNIANNSGYTPLDSATDNKHRRVVDVLVKSGADINLANNNCFMTLHTVAAMGSEEIVQFLVEAGADVNLVDENGDTPLNVASSNGHCKLVEFLIKSDANVNLANKNGLTPIKSASEKKHDKIVEVLLEAGAHRG